MTSSATPTDPPPVEPSGDDGRLTLRNTLAGFKDIGPTLATGGGIVLLLGVVLWFVRCRRAADRYDDIGDDTRRAGRHERFDLGLDTEATTAPASSAPDAPEPDRVPFAPQPPPLVEPEVVHVAETTPDGSRALLEVSLQPRRAGTNLTSAAVEYDLLVRNSGNVAAEAVLLDVRLLSAGAQHDGLVAALFADPIERPITPAFDLPPGGEVKLGGMGILPRDMVIAMTIEGRQLFVPLMTANLVYRWAGGSGQTGRSFVVGIERGPGVKMGAFRLDEVRMFTDVGALAYTIAVDR